jgi:cellulose synthase/poly-beta-1,6-N-acetylglucosamine synthase-like glycosyltransferase
MEFVFGVLVFLLFVQSIVSFFGTMRFARYALAPQTARHSRNQRKAVVILPCKGLEHDFEENIRAYLGQEYRDYEVIFVTESEHDPAYPVLARLIKQSRRSAWLLVAGEATESGQKVHNLSTALDSLNSIDRRAEVLIFADSDARPAKTWLTDLVSPLNDRSVGATTGFRWYVPVEGGFATWLLSAWNASALAMLGERSGLAWGGATAIWRDSFGKWGIQQQWQGALSDDYVLTSSLREIGQRIKFVPGCLVASHADATWRELLEFTTRQLKITRVYAPRLWQLTCFSHLLFNFSFWGGLVLLVKSALMSNLNLWLFSLLTCTYLLGAMTAWARATVAAQLLTAERDRLWPRRWIYAAIGPLVSLVYLYNLAASAFSRRLTWRGIDYEMVSPRETRILHHPANQPLAEAPAPTRRRRKAPIRSS